MMFKLRTFLCLLALLLASLACGQIDSMVAFSVALTLTAQPTFTPLPLQPLLPSSSMPEYPSADSSDYQVIDVDPHEMMLTLDDLSPLPKYYAPEYDSVRHHRNKDVRNTWDPLLGEEYLYRTGRIDGWIAMYVRGDDTAVAPEWIEDVTVLYATSAGASIALNEYSDCDPTNPSNPISLGYNGIGDEGTSCMVIEKTSDGQEQIWYHVVFRYRNFYHSVTGFGRREDVQPGYIEAISYGLLSKLVWAPLSDYVTFYYEEVFPL